MTLTTHEQIREQLPGTVFMDSEGTVWQFTNLLGEQWLTTFGDEEDYPVEEAALPVKVMQP